MGEQLRSRSDRKALGHRPWRIISLTLVLALLTVGLVTVTRFPLNFDVAWFMTIARQALQGEQLYTDLIDVNPPLIVYLLMPAVILSDVAGLPDSLAAVILLVAMASVTIAWSVRLVGLCAEPRRAGLWILLLSFATLLVPARDFAQREHLMVVLTLPFVLVKWRRITDLDVTAPQASIAGTLAGVGFAIKPYFLLPWLAMELLSWCHRQRNESHLRPETWAVVCTITVYLLFVALLHPEYFSLMREIAPLYNSFSSDSARLLLTIYVAFPMLLVVLAAVFSRGASRRRKLATVFLVFACAAFLGALIQGKGWRYHSLPGLIATVVAWGVLLERSIQGSLAGTASGSDRSRSAFIVGLLVIGAYPFATGMGRALAVAKDSRAAMKEMTATVSNYPANSILVFGDVVSHAFPLVNSIGARSVSPFPSLWWLRVLYGSGERTDLSRRNNDTFKPGSVEQRLALKLVNRFVKTPPDLVLVDTLRHERFGGERFPYIEYFSQDPVFAKAWEKYERVGTVGQFSMWMANDAANGTAR